MKLEVLELKGKSFSKHDLEILIAKCSEYK